MLAQEEPVKAILDGPVIDEEHLQRVRVHLASMGTRASESSALPVPDAPASLPGHVLLESLWRLIKRSGKCRSQWHFVHRGKEEDANPAQEKHLLWIANFPLDLVALLRRRPHEALASSTNTHRPLRGRVIVEGTRNLRV